MAVETVPAKGAPFAKDSIIWQRKGPLPVWAWALLVLALVLGISVWRRNRRTAEAATVATGGTDTLPGDQSAPPVFIVPQAATPAVNVGPIVTPPVTVTVPTAPPGAGAPPPVAAPSSPAPVPAPTGSWVTIGKYTTKNPPWNSTLWGIWNHYKTTANWQAIWNHPLNADLRRKRGRPERIQAYDRVFVPGAR